MAPAAILKKDVVRPAGRCEARRPGASEANAAPARNRPAARAAIVEQADGRVLIEVTCPCGETTYLECEYQPPQGQQAPGPGPQ